MGRAFLYSFGEGLSGGHAKTRWLSWRVGGFCTPQVSRILGFRLPAAEPFAFARVARLQGCSAFRGWARPQVTFGARPIKPPPAMSVLRVPAGQTERAAFTAALPQGAREDQDRCDAVCG